LIRVGFSCSLRRLPFVSSKGRVEGCFSFFMGFSLAACSVTTFSPVDSMRRTPYCDCRSTFLDAIFLEMRLAIQSAQRTHRISSQCPEQCPITAE
jgi:hypothetical protein